MAKSIQQFKLYWVETPSPEENCFIAALTKRAAAKHEEDESGFDPGDCTATLVRLLDSEWVAEYLGHPSPALTEPFYIQFEYLHELGITRNAIEGDDVFEYAGISYVKQGDLNYIASLGRSRPQKIIIRSVSDLLEIIERDAPGDWIFRGHSAFHWKLAASIHRLLDNLCVSAEAVTSLEKQILNEFKRRARIFLPTRPASDWEWMVIGQHFGLPTRILDWTENPLVALYFSIREKIDGDGMLYAYRHGTPEIDIESASDPYAISAIELLRPPHLDQRVIAQQSVFTAEPSGLLAGGGREKSELRYWHVSASEKHRIKTELEKLGISESTLFPGLSSLAAEIKEHFSTARII